MTIEPRMESLNSAKPTFALEMQRMSLDMQMGTMPDPTRLKQIANDIDAAVDEWESLITRLRLSSDFQTKEYAKLTEAHLTSHNVSVPEIAAMMRWQSDCMRAMADSKPPPMPPASVDLAKMIESSNTEKPSITSMAAAESITSTPFTGKEAIFNTPTIKEEYERLCRDHMNLIQFGSKYDQFDPTGKVMYLDEVEKIEERWDIFFARFSLMGQLNREYVKQCDAFLASMSLSEEDYRKLLKKCHDMMRADAEVERNRLGL
jgi:D-alanyl-D-alanine dipeptidase